MTKFILKHNLCVMTALAVGVTAYLAINWSSMPALQRMVGLFFIGLVMHLWEEGRFPGGFPEMVTEHLHFTARSRTFGEVVTAGCVLVIAFVPLFLPNVPFLAMATMMLGFLEAVMHLGMIKIFQLKPFYSPGLVTALVVLLPISIYSIAYAIRQNVMPSWSYPLALLYMLFCFVVAQQIVVRGSGVKYTDFLSTVRAALSSKKETRRARRF